MCRVVASSSSRRFAAADNVRLAPPWPSCIGALGFTWILYLLDGGYVWLLVGRYVAVQWAADAACNIAVRRERRLQLVSASQYALTLDMGESLVADSMRCCWLDALLGRLIAVLCVCRLATRRLYETFNVEWDCGSMSLRSVGICNATHMQRLRYNDPR